MKIPPKNRVQNSRSTPFYNALLLWPLARNTVQAAIEYVYNNAPGKSARFTITLIHNGTVSNNEWLTYSELTPDVWIQFPFNCKLEEMTWGNKRTNRTFNLEFYKNGTGAGDIFRTKIISGQEYGYESGLGDTFNTGDRIRLKYKDMGLNAADMVVVLYMIKV